MTLDGPRARLAFVRERTKEAAALAAYDAHMAPITAAHMELLDRIDAEYAAADRGARSSDAYYAHKAARMDAKAAYVAAINEAIANVYEPALAA